MKTTENEVQMCDSAMDLEFAAQNDIHRAFNNEYL